MRERQQKRKLFLMILVALVIMTGCVWKVMRASCDVSCQTGEALSSYIYTEGERVRNAMALSYLIYGCENCEGLTGSVSDLLDTQQMGIVIENFGIKRLDKTDPSTAVFDSSKFIDRQVGNFRFLADKCDEKSGFYGAAFCDDEKKCIWIAYSGSVTVRDAFACAELILTPGLAAQEQAAFELYEEVTSSSEVADRDYKILLTGHSLGGALATEVACGSGNTAVTINGADGVAIDKMHGILGEAIKTAQISNYMTDPKNGYFSWMDVVQRFIFLGDYKAVDYHIYKENGLTTDSHSVFSFVEF